MRRSEWGWHRRPARHRRREDDLGRWLRAVTPRFEFVRQAREAGRLAEAAVPVVLTAMLLVMLGGGSR